MSRNQHDLSAAGDNRKFVTVSVTAITPRNELGSHRQRELLRDAGVRIDETAPVRLDDPGVALREGDGGTRRLRRAPGCIEEDGSVHAAVETRQHLAALARVREELIVPRAREPLAPKLLLLRLDLAAQHRQLAEMGTGHERPGISLQPADGGRLHPRALRRADLSSARQVHRAWA